MLIQQLSMLLNMFQNQKQALNYTQKVELFKAQSDNKVLYLTTKFRRTSLSDITLHYRIKFKNLLTDFTFFALL